MPVTAPGTPVAAGAFAISSEPREDQLRPVPHDAAGYPERAELCSIRQWHPSSERSKIFGGMEYFSGRLPSQCRSFLAGIA